MFFPFIQIYIYIFPTSHNGTSIQLAQHSQKKKKNQLAQKLYHMLSFIIFSFFFFGVKYYF